MLLSLTTKKPFLDKLQHILNDTGGYRERMDLIQRYRHLLDVRRIWYFDTFMHKFQRMIYPNETYDDSPHPLLQFSVEEYVDAASLVR